MPWNAQSAGASLVVADRPLAWAGAEVAVTETLEIEHKCVLPPAIGHSQQVGTPLLH